MATVTRRISSSLRGADFGALLLELVVLIAGILLALAVDRWNQDRLERIETNRIVERLRADTRSNLTMFERILPEMEATLTDVRALFRALESGTMSGADPAQIERAITWVDVVPSYPLLFAAYDELVATGGLRQLDDNELIDLLSNQRAEYEAAQAVVGYWRDSIQGVNDALDQHVEFYYTTELMDEQGMGARFDFADLAADRNVRNKVFDAVDVHGDWLRLQTSIYEVTREIDARLGER